MSKAHFSSSKGRRSTITLLLVLVWIILLRAPSISDGGSEQGNSSIIKSAVKKVQSSTTPPFEIYLFPPDQDIISKKIAANGLYEKDEVEFTKMIVQNGKGLMVDVGANLGFHSLHSAALGMQVISFEPSPDTAELLRESIQVNGMEREIRVFEAAAADTVGVGHLVRHKDSPGMTILVQQNDDNNEQPLPFGVEMVLDARIEMIRVGSVLRKLLDEPSKTLPLRLLKVDAEGWELHALRGVNLELYKFDYISIELFPELLWKAGKTDPVELLRYLIEFGYDCFVNPKSAVVGYGDVVCNEAWYQNEIKPQYKKDKTFHLNLFCKQKGEK